MTRERHGMSKTKIYKVWAEMINRCTNPNHQNARYYHDKGIGVCAEWRSFLKFYSDMGDKPEGAWLERVDNSKPYCKDNCKWETPSRQCSNRGNSTNTSGRIGVYWDKNKSKWRAVLKVDGVRKHIGYFYEFEAACDAIAIEELKLLGYSREGFV